MKIRYEIEFDEPLTVDGDWPLTLPSGGTFKIVQKNGKAIAFRVEFSGKPSDVFSVVDGIQSVTDFRWNEIRRFYVRLKSYLQCVTEIDFDPTEVYAHYIGETDDEKKQIPLYKMAITRGEGRRTKKILDHEIVAAAVFASYKDDVQAPYFIGELKRMSRRSKREGYYVDSFRYDFLIIETLYGKGNFKSKQLEDSLKSEKQLLDILMTAKERTKLTIETIKDDTDTLIVSSCSAEDLVKHIVRKRGYYFHGTKRMIRSDNWNIEEARILSVFSNTVTDMILEKLTSDIYDDTSWKQYEECARSQRMVTKLELNAQLWCTIRKKSGKVKHYEETIGDVSSPRNRVKWALSALNQMKYDEEDLRLESLIGEDRESGEELFKIRITRSESLNSNDGETGIADLSGSETTYIVKYEFSEEEEIQEYKFPSIEDSDSPWVNDRMAKWLLQNAMSAALGYGHAELFRITCKEEQREELLFEVTVCAAPAASH